MKRLLALIATCICLSNGYASNQENLTVLLDWDINTTHAPLIIAQQRGYFKEQGLTVKLIKPNHPGEVASLVAEQKADIGLAYEPWFIKNVDHGMPVVRIGTLIDKPLNCVVALKRSGIRTLNDLKGKEIGTTNNQLASAMLTNMLQRQGFADTDIRMMDVKQNLTEALLSHKVDAISGMMRNMEVPMLETAGHQVVVFFPEEHGIPNYSEIVFITNTQRINDPRFPKFLAAVKKAVRYLDEHPEQAWQQFTKVYPHLNNAMNRQYWFSTLPYFAENPSEFNRDDWQHFAKFMQQQKMIIKSQPIQKYAVNIG